MSKYKWNGTTTPYQTGFNHGYSGSKNKVRTYKHTFDKQTAQDYADGYERGVRDRASMDGTN